jgi:hypothetical protein
MADEPVNCRKAAKLLSQAQERPLRDEERKALSLHLSRCIHCSNFETQLAFLRKAAKVFAEGTKPK